MSETFYIWDKHENFNTYTDVLDFEVVYPNGVGLKFLIIVIISCLLLILIPAAFAIYGLSPWIKYELDGKETTAHVTSCINTLDRETKEYYHTIQYSFYPSTSTRYTGQDYITSSSDLCEEFANGKLLVIQYLAGDPNDSQIPRRFATVPLAAILLFSPVYLLLFGAFVELKNNIQAQFKWRRLAREGHIFPGEIISHPNKQKNDRFRRNQDNELYYTFITALGDRLVGKAVIPTNYREIRRKLVLPPPGTPVAILYAGGDCHVML